MNAAAAPIPTTDVESIPSLVDKARRAFDSGRTKPLAWRREQLQRLIDMLSDHGEEFVEALHADLGKPALEAFAADVASVKMEAKLALKKLKKWTRPEKVATPIEQKPARSRVVREPLGVVLIISPWNYPVQLLLSPLAAAIAAGNAVVLKPSEVTPNVSAVLARFVPAYLDPEAITLVEGGVEETTALLAERFDHIFYTGNGKVARVVMKAAAKNLTPVTLELGGKSPCIVAEDANLEVAARRIAWGKFLNAGQTCIAPDYVLVQESLEAELIGKLAAAIREFYGDDPHETEDFARVVNANHHARLSKLLKSGEVVFGGETDPSDNYIAPTLLRNVSPDDDIMQEEIFGPILPILTVPDVASAVDFVNEREKPLALYLFTENKDTEEQVISGTSSGGACVNGTIWHIANPNMPFGGVGPSGTGAYHGRHGFETFSHRKAVVTKSTRFDLKAMYPPYSAFKLKMIKRFM